MTTDEINDLLTKRDKIAVRYAYRTNQLDRIDRKLRAVPPGVDNRIDLALGRPGAQLPERADYGLSECAAEIAECHADWLDMRGDCDA